MKNMKAFRDGNRLILIIEDAGDVLEGMVAALLSEPERNVTHLAPPKPMTAPNLDLSGMEAVAPQRAKWQETEERPVREAAKFIKQKQAEQTAAKEQHTPSESVGNVPMQEPKAVPDTVTVPVSQMNVFQLRDYILKNARSRNSLNIIPFNMPAEAYLMSRSENELRDLAKKVCAV